MHDLECGSSSTFSGNSAIDPQPVLEHVRWESIRGGGGVPVTAVSAAFVVPRLLALAGHSGSWWEASLAGPWSCFEETGATGLLEPGASWVCRLWCDW